MKNFIKLMGLMILSITSMQAAAVVAPANPFIVLAGQLIATISDNNHSQENLNALVTAEKFEQILAEYKEYTKRCWAQNPIGGPIEISNNGHKVIKQKQLCIICISEVQRFSQIVKLWIDIYSIPTKAILYAEMHLVWTQAMSYFERLLLEENIISIDFGVAA